MLRHPVFYFPLEIVNSYIVRLQSDVVLYHSTILQKVKSCSSLERFFMWRSFHYKRFVTGRYFNLSLVLYKNPILLFISVSYGGVSVGGSAISVHFITLSSKRVTAYVGDASTFVNFEKQTSSLCILLFMVRHSFVNTSIVIKRRRLLSTQSILHFVFLCTHCYVSRNNIKMCIALYYMHIKLLVLRTAKCTSNIKKN